MEIRNLLSSPVPSFDADKIFETAYPPQPTNLPPQSPVQQSLRSTYPQPSQQPLHNMPLGPSLQDISEEEEGRQAQYRKDSRLAVGYLMHGTNEDPSPFPYPRESEDERQHPQPPTLPHYAEPPVQYVSQPPQQQQQQRHPKRKRSRKKKQSDDEEEEEGEGGDYRETSTKERRSKDDGKDVFSLQERGIIYEGRKKRTVWTKKQRELLEESFAKNPSPSTAEKETLANSLNLSVLQIHYWYISLSPLSLSLSLSLSL